MGLYGGYCSITPAAAKPEWILASDGNIQPMLTEVRGGITSTPDDYMYTFGIWEISAIGSGGTSITPSLKRPSATSSATVKKGTFAADPTQVYTNCLMEFHNHMRNRYFMLWDVLMGPSAQVKTSAYGLSMWCITAPGSVTGTHTFHWFE